MWWFLFFGILRFLSGFPDIWKGVNLRLSPLGGVPNYGEFEFTLRYAYIRGVPLGFLPPPGGSIVTNTASIWSRVLLSSTFITQRFLEALSSEKTPSLRA